MSTEVTFLLPKQDGWCSLEPASTEENEIQKAKRNQEKINQHLLSAMQMQNIVVLAGSGTSLGNVKGPSMWDLWCFCTKSSSNYTTEAQAICKKVGYDISTDDNVNIEEFLSLCEAYQQLNNDIEVEKFIEHCKGTILRACSFSKDDDTLAGHKTFVHRLSRRRGRDARLKLFTTNYDTCFEEAASAHGIVIVDGFSFSRPRIYDPSFFDYDIVRRNPQSEDDRYLPGVFQLFKLHGSVTWEKDGMQIVEKEATPKGACMIFPAKGKYQQSYIQPHLELMARYLATLREPNTCVVISGFGFNDDHLSEPIISAIKSNPYLKVIIADYSAEINIKGTNDKASSYWENLKTLNSKGEDVSFINATFQEFADLIPDLRSLSPAEKMAQAVKGIVGKH